MPVASADRWGKPMILDDIRIVDDRGRELPVGEIGEICGYSVGLMKGYYNDPAATEKAIWYGPDGRSYFRSGDLGRFDADGYLYICGRSKDIIKVGRHQTCSRRYRSRFCKPSGR